MIPKQALKLKNKIVNFPARPGIYKFLNNSGEVLYVGKAKNLRTRVRQYFGTDDNRPQIPFLMAEATDINYTIVTNELESAFLENTLIKQHHPKFNIDLKDDKNYAFIKIDFSTEIPTIGYCRTIDSPTSYKFPIRQAKGGPATSYFFGPYSATYKIRNTLNLVRKIFSFCSNKKVSSRPCFYYHMHRCPGVCIGKIGLIKYRDHLKKIAKFLQGDTSAVYKEIKLEMSKAAEKKQFEIAARLRDQLKALELLDEKQNVILAKKVDWDIVSLVEKNGFVCVNLFKIRGGKMFDKENFVYSYPKTDKAPDKNLIAQIQQRFLEQYYSETSSMPKIINTQTLTINQKLVTKILRSRFKKSPTITSPQKGQAKKLINLGRLNAEEFLKIQLNNKATDLDKIDGALKQLKEILSLPTIPKRIEAYDISNIQGTNPVGSMVVFKDGLPTKNEYRKFKIQGKNTPDDFAMMKEILSRRIARSHSDGKFQNRNNKSQINSNPWPLPDLIVIDGGKGQLNAALSVLQAANNKLQTIPIIGLAKKIEEIFLPGQSEPIILNHDQPALQLLQRLRDEAHRFGITFHRSLRSKQAIRSALDDILGVGPKTKKILKEKFGTIKNIKLAEEQVLASLVGKNLSKRIKQSL